MSSDEGFKRLLDVSTFISRGITPAYVDAGGVAVINQKCIRNGNVDLSQARKTDPNKKRIQPDKFLREFDILVNSTGVGTLGRVGQIFGDLGEITADSHITIVRPDTNKVDPTYLGYVLKSLQRNIEALAEGSTGQTELSRHKLGELLFLELDISEQKAVGQLCKALDDRITLLLETNMTLEAIAQAIFKSWFVNFDPVRAKSEGKLPESMDSATAAQFPDSFEETDLGMVPRGWKFENLDSVSQVGIGKTPPRKESHWFSEDVSDIRWASIRDMGAAGAYLTDTSEYLTQEAVNKFNVRKIPDGMVMLSFKLTIGRVAISDGEMTSNEAIAHCKLNESSSISSEYLYLYLKLFDYSTLSSTSSIADAVNSKTIKEIPVLVPEDNVIKKFNEVATGIFLKIKNNQRKVKTLRNIRDTLLPRLISGRLSLSVAKQMVSEII